ncbi:acetylornithine aminotransferase [Thiomicrospira sp. XS5]|uniref:acetylornithine transaminase n=1 Tax=Thiomicrospira sp. XS5 TaxID=1775636 RepID=UPI00074705C1|nr:acetylornithine transaminase [Thiomicrospira sp. XS5]KUJ74685.1 acetylornithine aminotransferase [Thiomicrospira sp. XS5]
MKTSPHLMNTYARLPVCFKSGKGAWLYDEHGQNYLDAISGIAVCSLGHAHPEITETICAQSRELIHTSNLYCIEKQAALAENLIEISGMEKVFFCNSGAEANETAIKIARKYAYQQQITAPKIIVMENSFHGRTLATLSATGNKKVQEGFAPLVDGFVRVPFGDAGAIEALSEDSDIVAVLVEPIQGEGGVNIPPKGYLKTIRDICDRNGWLMMLDEIQTGIGRTGKWFAHQHEGIQPDVMSLAKALGNGLPIGACLAGQKAADILEPGNHGTTFGGNPLASAAGLAVLKVMKAHNFIEHVAEKGQEILTRFQSALADNPSVKDVRGLGYMIGIELDRPCGELVAQALEQHVLINVTQGNTIRLLPAFVMSNDQTDQLIDTVVELVNQFTRQD